MKISVYAVRDSYLGFGMPVIRDNDSVASRAFEYDINRNDSPYTTRPETYQLYRIGDYDTDTGDLVGCSPILVASATDFIIKVGDK